MHDLDQLVDDVRDRLDSESGALPEALVGLREADVADVMNNLLLVEAAEVIKRLPPPLAVRVCDQPTLRRRSTIFEELDPVLAARILEDLSADERASVIRGISPFEQHRILPKVSAEVQREIKQLLQYPPRTAGGIMTTEFVSLQRTMTVSQALEIV